MALSDAEAARILATNEGAAIVRSVRLALMVDRFRNARTRDLRSLLASIEATIRRAVRGRVDRIASRGAGTFRLSAVSELERRISEILTRNAIDKLISQIQPDLRQIALRLGSPRTAIVSATVRGLPLRDHFSQWAASTARRIRGVVVNGLNEGANSTQILAGVGRAVGTAKVQAESVLRTAITSTAVQARENTLIREGNEFIRYVAVLDERTTIICLSLNGTVWPVSEGPRPPQHFRCRSFIAEATSSEVEEFSQISLDQIMTAA